MTRFNGLTSRLANLENRTQSTDATLIFADCSRRAFRLKDPLSVLLAAMSRHSWFVGPPEGSQKEGPPLHRCEGAAMPASAHDSAIELLGRSTDVESNDVFLKFTVAPECRMVADGCKLLKEREKMRKTEDHTSDGTAEERAAILDGDWRNTPIAEKEIDPDLDSRENCEITEGRK